MHILFLSTWFPYPPDNGAKIRVYHLLRALAAKHRVTLASFVFDTARPNEADVLRHWGIDVHVVQRNPFERSPMTGALRFFSRQPIVTHPLPAMADMVRKLLTETQFDVVLASIEVMATYALMAPNSAIKILEEHNSLSRWMWERYRVQSSAIQRLRCWISWNKTRHFEASLFRQFDLCMMVSELDRAASMTMLPSYHGPVEVVPNGVDCQHNHPGLARPRPNALVYNGSLTYSANYDAMQWFLADVYPQIKAEEPSVALTVTGSTSNVDLTGLALDDTVHFTGLVDDVRLPVAQAAACVAPLRQGGGTRLKILESMALGTPVVSTSKGAEGLEVRHGEHLLLADDAPTFAQHVLTLLRDPALGKRLGAQARRLVEQHYDWSFIGQRFLRLVEDVTNRRPP